MNADFWMGFFLATAFVLVLAFIFTFLIETWSDRKKKRERLVRRRTVRIRPGAFR